MKAAAILLVLLVLAALFGVGWLYFNSNLEVTFVNCIADDPVSRQDVFNSLKSSLENGSFVGTVYNSSAGLSSPEDYLFYTWTVRLENKSFLPVNVIEIQVTPMSGDILCIGDPSEHTLSPRRSSELSVTLLTARTMHSVREAVVTWYVWGLPFSVRRTLGR